LAAFLSGIAMQAVQAQQEVYHPGETYDSLQAGQDAFADAEAQRRAIIGRQLLIEEQIVQQNTWADPQDKYRPVRPESYGPILPKSHAGPTLADVYANPPAGGPVYYRGAPGGTAASPSGSAGTPVFQPWPRVPNDIWAAPYYGYVRQPIGHVKIWTGPLSYIYKPVYASPPMVTAQPAGRAIISVPPQPPAPPRFRGTAPRSPAESSGPPPPPPKPVIPPAAQPDAESSEIPDMKPAKRGQEI
jgi:hypothetical protein